MALQKKVGEPESIDSIARDAEWAAKFWEKQPRGMRSVMLENIANAVQQGPEISFFVDKDGITDDDRRRLSAYRQLAKENGYEIGEYRLNRDSWTVTAEIRK